MNMSSMSDDLHDLIQQLAVNPAGWQRRLRLMAPDAWMHNGDPSITPWRGGKMDKMRRRALRLAVPLGLALSVTGMIGSVPRRTPTGRPDR
jgi:hypothetical protein